MTKHTTTSAASATAVTAAVLSSSFSWRIPNANANANNNADVVVVVESSNTKITTYENYDDKNCGFRVKMPSGWETSTQELPDRRKIVFFIEPSTASSSAAEEDKTLAFIAYTPVRDDFTSISSFGSVDQVAQATILPMGNVGLRSDSSSEMLFSESKKSAYIFDYTIKADNQPKRHFRTIFTLITGATGGAGSVLVTITAQTSESKYGSAMKGVFDEIINSYDKLK